MDLKFKSKFKFKFPNVTLKKKKKKKDIFFGTSVLGCVFGDTWLIHACNDMLLGSEVQCINISIQN